MAASPQGVTRCFIVVRDYLKDLRVDVGVDSALQLWKQVDVVEMVLRVLLEAFAVILGALKAVLDLLVLHLRMRYSMADLLFGRRLVLLLRLDALAAELLDFDPILLPPEPALLAMDERQASDEAFVLLQFAILQFFVLFCR